MDGNVHCHRDLPVFTIPEGSPTIARRFNAGFLKPVP